MCQAQREGEGERERERWVSEAWKNIIMEVFVVHEYDDRGCCQ